jgi:hypothetical protein
MLGIRRASVTVAAGILQKAGLIPSAGGEVTILNRKAWKTWLASATASSITKWSVGDKTLGRAGTNLAQIQGSAMFRSARQIGTPAYRQSQASCIVVDPTARRPHAPSAAPRERESGVCSQSVCVYWEEAPSNDT